jgi:hypothetical protein
VSAFFNNPEMLRNARIQLRPGRVCRVKAVVERPEHLHSRISSGEVT